MFIHCKIRLAIFPSPALMSLTKLSLAGNNFYSVQGKYTSVRMCQPELLPAMRFAYFSFNPRSGYDLPLSLPLWGVGDGVVHLFCNEGIILTYDFNVSRGMVILVGLHSNEVHRNLKSCTIPLNVLIEFTVNNYSARSCSQYRSQTILESQKLLR